MPMYYVKVNGENSEIWEENSHAPRTLATREAFNGNPHKNPIATATHLIIKGSFLAIDAKNETLAQVKKFLHFNQYIETLELTCCLSYKQLHQLCIALSMNTTLVKIDFNGVSIAENALASTGRPIASEDLKKINEDLGKDNLSIKMKCESFSMPQVGGGIEIVIPPGYFTLYQGWVGQGPAVSIEARNVIGCK